MLARGRAWFLRGATAASATTRIRWRLAAVVAAEPTSEADAADDSDAVLERLKAKLRQGHGRRGAAGRRRSGEGRVSARARGS